MDDMPEKPKQRPRKPPVHPVVQVVQGLLDIAAIRIVLRQGMVLLALWAFYNHLDPRDIKTIVLSTATDMGITFAKKRDDE